jgi:hypothetical protein
VHPLAKGTRVAAWRVKAWQGQGSYGAVYRAERGGFRRSEPGALKVSLLPWNWRMEREVELLSRLSHPSIPSLLDRGGPQPPSGEYPFFVMEWVQGTPLYAWAEQHAPSGQQLCRVLAQLARALQAVHASRPPGRARAWKPWLALAAAATCAVVLWSSKGVPLQNAQAPDGGSTAIGDSSPTEPQAATLSPKENRPITQEPVPLPRPGQARPDEKGRCPGHKQVPINGGCWVELLPMSGEKCVESGYVPFQGKCYLPAPAPPKKPAPTSSPGQAR